MLSMIMIIIIIITSIIITISNWTWLESVFNSTGLQSCARPGRGRQGDKALSVKRLLCLGSMPYTYIYIYIYMYTCVYIYISLYIYIYIYTH